MQSHYKYLHTDYMLSQWPKKYRWVSNLNTLFLVWIFQLLVNIQPAILGRFFSLVVVISAHQHLMRYNIFYPIFTFLISWFTFRGQKSGKRRENNRSAFPLFCKHDETFFSYSLFISWFPKTNLKLLSLEAQAFQSRTLYWILIRL